MKPTITCDRWRTTKLDPVYRPNTIYEYYVSGRSPFPFDMLRHDAAWPLTSGDASKMDGQWSKQVRSIAMRSYFRPTVDRWSTFGWSVGNDKLDE